MHFCACLLHQQLQMPDTWGDLLDNSNTYKGASDLGTGDACDEGGWKKKEGGGGGSHEKGTSCPPSFLPGGTGGDLLCRKACMPCVWEEEASHTQAAQEKGICLCGFCQEDWARQAFSHCF